MHLAMLTVRRLLAAAVVLFAVSILTFLIFISLPNGDPAVRLAGRTATAADIAAVRHTYGFDQSVWVQYTRIMGSIFNGTITSYTQHVTVISQIERGFPATLSLRILSGLERL